MRVGHKVARAVWCTRVLPDTAGLGGRCIGTTNSSELYVWMAPCCGHIDNGVGPMGHALDRTTEEPYEFLHTPWRDGSLRLKSVSHQYPTLSGVVFPVQPHAHGPTPRCSCGCSAGCNGGGAPRNGRPACASGGGRSGNGSRSFSTNDMATQPKPNVREKTRSGYRTTTHAAMALPPSLHRALTNLAMVPPSEVLAAAAAATPGGAVIDAGNTTLGAEVKTRTLLLAAAGERQTPQITPRVHWSTLLGLISPAAPTLLPPLLLPMGRPPSSAAARSMSVVAPTITQELRSCTSIQHIQDVVNRHKSRMRLMHHAEVVVQLGLLTYGSRSKQRVAARHLAVECTAAALASASGVGGGDGGSGLAAVGLDVLVVLIRGWSWVRKPPPELLTRMLEALVPGSGIGAGCGEHPHNTQNAHSAHGVRQGYGRLHTATLCDAAALVEPLAALEALTPPLLEVLINIAVRRAGNEAPTVVAAAAVAYGRAGVTDPRVAQAFLEATAVRRHGGAAAAAVGHIAEALGLCAKAAWYDPRVFAAAADALVARGVGGLTVRQTWSVLRAFAGTQHEHPLLKDALAAHAKALFIKSTSKTESGTESKFETNFEERDDPAGGHLKFVDRQRGDADAAATAAAAIEFAGLDTDVSGSGGAAAAAADVDANVDVNVTSTAPRQLSEERELTRQLSTLAGLVHGFSTMQVYDRELYERLAAGAAALLLRAMAIHLGESQPRALAAALTALLSGFAGAGFYPARLLEVMTAQQQGWTRSISVEQAHSLTCALAQLRHRDERLLDRLDEAAAAFLARTIAVAAAAAGLLSPAAGGNGSAAATATTTTAAVAAAAAATTPDVSWLPSFLDAACRQLSYPCPRTVATLAAAAATWDLDEYGNTVLRGLSKGKKEKRELAAVDSTAVVREGGSGAPETISRLQLLLLLVVEQSRSRQQGGSGSGSSSGSGGGPLLTPQWVCELVGALASSGARLREDEEQDLAWLLAKSIEPRMERKGAAAPAAAAAGGDESSSVWKGPMAEGLQAGGQTEMDAAAEQWPLPQRRRRRKGLTPAQAAAALDDTAACHLFRAVIASQYFSNTRNGDEAGAEDFDDEEAQSGYSYVHEEGAASRRGGSGGGGVRSDEEGDDGDGAGRRGLEAALHRALTAPVAAALLARAASAWHAAGLGTAAPRNAPHHVAISAHANAMVATMAPQPPRRLRRGGGAANSPLLSELLRSLGLPVFEQWETADGYFRVSRGLVLPGGRHVGVEVLPEAAFAASNAAANSDRSGPYPVLIGDAAFRARCLASRGWRLVALPEDEWAAAAMAGPAACMVLMRRHSGGL